MAARLSSVYVYALLLSSPLLGDDINPVPTERQRVPDPRKDRQVTPSARPQVQGGINLYLTGDWLYFKPQEKGLTYALESNATSSATLGTTIWNLGNGKYKSTNFDWSSGFRVGIGWNTKHDDWDFLLSWMRFYSHEKNSVASSGSTYVFPTLGDPAIALGPVASASANFQLHLNQIELSLGREFYVSRALSLKPLIGIVTSWIDQKYITNYDTMLGMGSLLAGTFNKNTNNNDFWGSGLKGGMNTQWDLGWGFSIFGNGALSILYGKFDVKKTSEVNASAGGAPIDKNPSARDNFYLARYIADVSLGLRFDYMFNDDRIHLGLQGGWEDHIYFGQNQMLTSSNIYNVGHNEPANQDLTLQGFALSARLDF
jgi:hypothetical protein